MQEVEIHLPKKETRVSDVLGTSDYSMGTTVDIEDEFSITYDGEPLAKDLDTLFEAVQFTVNINMDVTDVTDYVSLYIAEKLESSSIAIDGEEIENPTKEKIDEAFKKAIEDE